MTLKTIFDFKQCGLFVGKPDKLLVVFHETRMVTDQALGLGSNNDENQMAARRAGAACKQAAQRALCSVAAAAYSSSITDKRGFYGDMEQAKLSFTAKRKSPGSLCETVLQCQYNSGLMCGGS